MATSESHPMQFEDLNCHVLEIIFEHLCLRDFLRVASTCHHFYKLILGNLVLPTAPGAKKRKRTPVSQSKNALFTREFERYAKVARARFLYVDTSYPKLICSVQHFPDNIKYVSLYDDISPWLSPSFVMKISALAGLDFLKCLFNMISTRCVTEYHKECYSKMAEALRRVAHGFARRVPRDRSLDPLACLSHAQRLLEIESDGVTTLAAKITAPGNCFPYKVVSALTSMVMQSADAPTYLSPTIPPNNADYLIMQAARERAEYLNSPL